MAKIPVELKQLEDWFKSMLGSVPVHKTAPETKEMINDLESKIDTIGAHFDERGIITRIEKHVKYTNGCVAENTKWRNYLFTAVVIFGFLFPVMTGAFAYFMSDLHGDLQDEMTIMIEANNHKFFEL